MNDVGDELDMLLDDVSNPQGEDSESDAEKSDESLFGYELPAGFFRVVVRRRLRRKSSPPPTFAPAPPAPGPDSVVPFNVVLRAECFGCFRLTPKKGGLYGGFQAACRFHKKNSKTGCKVFFRISGPTQCDRTQCVREMLWWCLRAPDFDRQRTHISFQPKDELDDIPSNETLLALRIDDAPILVSDDDTLDAFALDAGPPTPDAPDALAVPEPVALVVVPVSGHRGRGGRGRRGRGRGGGEPAKAPSSCSPSSSSAGSSSD